MKLPSAHLSNWLLFLPAIFAGMAPGPAASAAEKLSFQRDVRPILSDHCFACHGPDEQERKADLRLDVDLRSPESTVVVPGKADESQVWKRIVSRDPDEVMPPPDFHKPLTEAHRETLRRWIEEGAEFQQHWAFVAPRKPDAPRNDIANPIDAFLQAKLDGLNLRANPPADRLTLLRRITLDLTGLPPTLAEINSFMADKSEEAYIRRIEDLMSRVTYGEHMARYWLDLARYADTHGLHLDNERSMWPYRDWVVRAFHENIPFDEFTRWQLAGDLLPNPTDEQLVASGFNRCNVSTSEGGSINEEWIYRYAVDRTTTMAEVWMGLTAGCAVCHDHKFDPLSTKEYYSMYAFFHSAADPAMDGNIIDTPPILRLRNEEQKKAVAAIDAEIAAVKKERQAIAAQYQYRDPAEQSPPPEPIEHDVVLMEDDFPKGAKLDKSPAGKWIGLVDGPIRSGELAYRQTTNGLGQTSFRSMAVPVTIPAAAKIVVDCYLDPASPPEAIMVQFHSDGWKHRAVWGNEAKIPYGKAGTTEKFYAGPLPETGRWVRLEVTPSKLGIKSTTKLTGFALTQFDGTVTWDRLGTRRTVDTTKDVEWSYKAWKDAYVGKGGADLPRELRDLVRGVKESKWSPDEAKTIFEYWLFNRYAGDEDGLGPNKKAFSKLEDKKKAIDENLPLTFVMAELPTKRESFVMLRGAYDKPGDKVARDVPSFLPPLPKRDDGDDYDRLDLANWLVSGEHPLTARVTVNRIWQQFFGVGLVKTSGDFGSQGEPPSHPELLDFLAVQFVEDGWDIQKLVKRILTSEAYRRSSKVNAASLRSDPENRWLSRGPRLRLDAEVLRDQALFVSGLLVDKVGGKGVKPYQPPNIWEPVGFGNSNTRYYTQDTGESLYRRSLYTFLKRTAPPPFMSTFDAPNREQSCSFRERSNTPLQALQLMNDIQHVEAARHFAQRILKEGGKTPEARLRWAWRSATGRRPGDEELDIVLKALDDHAARYRSDQEAASQLVAYGESKPDESIDSRELAAYTLVANLILNLDETLCKN